MRIENLNKMDFIVTHCLLFLFDGGGWGGEGRQAGEIWQGKIFCGINFDPEFYRIPCVIAAQALLKIHITGL